MQIIQTGLENLALMGINPDQSLFNVKFLVALAFNIENIGGNFAFLFHEANTFIEYANSIFLTSTVTTVAVCFVLMASNKSHIFETIGSFGQLVEKRMRTPSLRSMYMETNQMAEKWSKLAILAFARVTPVAFVFSKAALIYLIYYAMDGGRDAFDLPYSMWFPWDWRTPVGYIVAVIIQYILTSYVFLFGAFALVMGLGCILIGRTIVKDMCASINSFNDIANSDGNRLQMMEQLSDFMDTHSGLIELFGELFNLIQLMCKVFFLWCLTVTCIMLLLFQVEISKPEKDYIALFVVLFELFDVIWSVFIACELGERACSMFSAVDETMDEIDWYLYPIEIKRMLPAILIVTQKPIYVELFGSISASRETFKRVMKGGWSFFTVLSEFA